MRIRNVVAGPFQVANMVRWIVRCPCSALFFVSESQRPGWTSECAACRTVHKVRRYRNPSLAKAIRSAAHIAVNLAVESQVIERQPCKNGCAQRAVAHHGDYSRPLDVEWLCPRCHRLRHREIDSAGLDLMGTWTPVLAALVPAEAA